MRKKKLDGAAAAATAGLNLPEDVFMEILINLPVKSLLRFKCLSKSFFSLISNPDFVQLHLHHQSQNHKRLILQLQSISAVDKDHAKLSYFDYDPNSGEANQFKLQGFNRDWLNPYFKNSHEILCSCDGLLCILFHKSNYLLLWNPFTRERRGLPSPRLRVAHFYFGLGFDSASNDYKLIQYWFNSRDKKGFNVLSLKSNSWRRIPNFMHRIICFNQGGLLLNGALHWLSAQENSGKYIILGFTLADEKFLELPLFDDSGGGRHNYFDMQMGVLQDCLCIVDPVFFIDGSEKYNVWWMKKYGDSASWTKLTTIMEKVKYNFRFSSAPFCLSKNEIWMIKQNSDKLVVLCDFEREEFRDIKICNCQLSLSDLVITCFTYVESLVWPETKNSYNVLNFND